MQTRTPLPVTGFAHPQRNVANLGIEPGMTVADFGAGSGAYVYAIAEALAHAGRVYAIDVQKDLLMRIKNEAHRRGYKNVEIIWTDLEHPNGSKLKALHADVVLISITLFQVEHKLALLAEARRILKPRGLLALIDWSDSFNGMGPIKKHVLKKDEALNLLGEAGFALVREFDAGAHHYGLIGKVAPVV